MKLKWVILALCSSVMYGTYYQVAMPASLHRQLKELMPQGGFETNFQLQFTLTQAPGMILPFFAGAFIDRFGGRQCILALSIVGIIGQILTSIGAEMTSWSVLLAGRFVFGLSMESLFASNQTFLSSWFEGKQLGLALGISCAVSNVGLLLSHVLSPIFSNTKNAAFSYWVGTMIMGMSVLSSVIIFILDKMHARRTPDANSRVTPTEPSFENECMESSWNDPVWGTNENNRTNNSSAWSQALGMLRKLSCSYWLLCCLSLLNLSILRGFTGIQSALLLDRNLFKPLPYDCVLQYPEKCSSGYLAPAGGNYAHDSTGEPCPNNTEYAPMIPQSLNITSGQSSWKETQYIFEELAAADIYCTDPFWAEACTSNYCSRQGDAIMKAGLYMSIPLIVTVATSYLFGHFLVDQMGWRAEMLIVAPLLLMVEHFLFAYTENPLVLPLILDGFALSILLSAVWPSIPLTVEKDVRGRAFGLLTCVQGIGLTLFPVVISIIYTRSGEQYKAVEVFLILSAMLAFFMSVMLIYVDKKNGSVLGTVYVSDDGQVASRNFCRRSDGSCCIHVGVSDVEEIKEP